MAIKLFKIFVTYIVAPGATVISLAYGFDRYVIGRAETAVKPVEGRVTSLENGLKDTNAMLRVMGSHMMTPSKFEERLEQEKLNNP
jgi:hypothetical protein